MNNSRKVAVRCLWVVGAAACGLALGVAIRAARAPKTASLDSVAVSAVEGNARVQKIEGNARGNDDASPVATELELNLVNSTGVTRWLHWFAALEKAAPRDFSRLAKLAKGNVTALRFLGARWVEVAPRHMFDTFVAMVRSGGEWMDEELVTVLFDEWPKRHPDAAIEALTQGEDFGMRDDLRFRVAYTLIDRDVERAMRLMAEWNVEETGFGSRGLKAVGKWTADNPRHAAEFMLQQPGGYGAVTAMEAVGQQWAKVDPAGAMAFAVAAQGDLAGTLARAALKQWSENNVAAASEWLAGTDEPTRNRLSQTFVQTWGKQDATAALAWCEENLTGSTLAQAVGGVLGGSAEKNVTAAAALVAAMGPSAARTEGAMAVAKKWFPQMSTGRPVPAEAIAWLGGLDGSAVRRVIDKVTWGWATSDPQTMAAFLAHAPAEQISTRAYTVVATELARNNPLEALQWAAQLSQAQALVAGSTAFAEWRVSQPAAADNWLSKLPASDPRRQSFFEGTIRSLVYHPQAAEQFAAMTPAERATAREVVAGMQLPKEQLATLLEKLK